VDICQGPDENHITRKSKILPAGPTQLPANAKPNGPNEALEPLSNSHLVELSVFAGDMKNFAEQLRPLVSLDNLVPTKWASPAQRTFMNLNDFS